MSRGSSWNNDVHLSEPTSTLTIRRCTLDRASSDMCCDALARISPVNARPVAPTESRSHLAERGGGRVTVWCDLLKGTPALAASEDVAGAGNMARVGHAGGGNPRLSNPEAI